MSAQKHVDTKVEEGVSTIKDRISVQIYSTHTPAAFSRIHFQFLLSITSDADIQQLHSLLPQASALKYVTSPITIALSYPFFQHGELHLLPGLPVPSLSCLITSHYDIYEQS